MNRLKHLTSRLASGVAALAILGACSSDGEIASSPTEKAAGQATPVATRRISASATPIPDHRMLVAQAIENLEKVGPYGQTIVTKVQADSLASQTTQQFSFDGPARMVLREENDKTFEVVVNGSALYVREPDGVWRTPVGVGAAAYTGIAKLYDLSGTIAQRETRETYEGRDKLQLVTLVAGTDSIVKAAEKIVADNPSLKSNLLQTKLSSIKMEYYLSLDEKLIKRAVLTIEATFNDRPVKTVVDFAYKYDQPFSFPSDSPLAGR